MKSVLMNNKSDILVTIIACLLFIIPVTWMYLGFGVGYPFGWDTTWYIEKAQEISQVGILPSLITSDANLYPVLLVIVGYIFGNYIQLEILATYVLGCAYIFIQGLWARRLFNEQIWRSCMILFAGLSLNSIRIAVDLLRQLLALNVAGIIFLITDLKTTRVRRTIAIFLLFVPLRSIQFETFMVTFGALVVASVLEKDKMILWIIMGFIVLSPFVVASLLFYVSTQEIEILTSPEILIQSVYYSGAWIFPAVILGYMSLFFLKNQSSSKLPNIFKIWNVFLFLLIAMKWIFLLPVPFHRMLLVQPLSYLGTLGLSTSFRYMNEKPFNITQKKWYKHLNKFTIFVALAGLAGQSFIVYPTFYTYYIPPPAIQKLYSLQDTNWTLPPIFLVNMPIEYPPLITLYDRYFSTIIGEHDMYYGSLSELYALVDPTLKYPDSMSDLRTQAADKYDNLISNSEGTLFDRPIVILSDLYWGYIPSWFGSKNDGVIILTLNETASTLSNNIYLTSVDAVQQTEFVYSWTISSNQLIPWGEMYRDTADSTSVEFLIPITTSGNYDIMLQYRDLNASYADLKIFVDSVLASSIVYTGTSTVLWKNFTSPLSSTPGFLNLTIINDAGLFGLSMGLLVLEN